MHTLHAHNAHKFHTEIPFFSDTLNDIGGVERKILGDLRRKEEERRRRRRRRRGGGLGVECVMGSGVQCDSFLNVNNAVLVCD
jgi:hypothetical protein